MAMEIKPQDTKKKRRTNTQSDTKWKKCLRWEDQTGNKTNK